MEPTWKKLLLLFLRDLETESVLQYFEPFQSFLGNLYFLLHLIRFILVEVLENLLMLEQEHLIIGCFFQKLSEVVFRGIADQNLPEYLRSRVVIIVAFHNLELSLHQALLHLTQTYNCFHWSL